MRVARGLKPGRKLRDTITLLRHRIALAFDTRAFLVAGYARMHVCAWMNTQQSGAGLPDRHGSVVPTAFKVVSKSLVDICIFSCPSLEDTCTEARSQTTGQSAGLVGVRNAYTLLHVLRTIEWCLLQ